MLIIQGSNGVEYDCDDGNDDEYNNDDDLVQEHLLHVLQLQAPLIDVLLQLPGGHYY